jgi:hypothetical protein
VTKESKNIIFIPAAVHKKGVVKNKKAYEKKKIPHYFSLSRVSVWLVAKGGQWQMVGWLVGWLVG